MTTNNRHWFAKFQDMEKHKWVKCMNIISLAHGWRLWFRFGFRLGLRSYIGLGRSLWSLDSDMVPGPNVNIIKGSGNNARGTEDDLFSDAVTEFLDSGIEIFMFDAVVFLKEGRWLFESLEFKFVITSWECLTREVELKFTSMLSVRELMTLCLHFL